MSALPTAPVRPTGFYPGELEMLRKRSTPARSTRTAAEWDAIWALPDFSTARQEEGTERQDRHRPLGQISGIDRWIPEYEEPNRLPEWMPGGESP